MSGRSLKYADIYIKSARRALRTPRVGRPWRTRKLLNLTAFFRNRFYEIDRWYKARIEKPIVYPHLYVIQPEKHLKTLEERMKEFQTVEQQKINIGFHYECSIPSASPLNAAEKAELEEEARLRKLKLDLETIEEENSQGSEPMLVKQMAEHYGIFRDLFHSMVYFYPIVPLKILFPIDNENAHRVYYGNILKPEEVKSAPLVSFKAESNTYWTLMAVNLDGNPYENDTEMLHWFVSVKMRKFLISDPCCAKFYYFRFSCNIEAGQLETGEVISPYLQPLPFRGTGLHRVAFLLFKQTQPFLEHLSEFKETIKADTLAGRSFSVSRFYQRLEDVITPAGLAFFQCEWDSSCTACFHDILNMKEPVYKYQWPAPYIPPQEYIPEEPQPFNEYLDKYRDVESIEKQLLMKRLSRSSAFQCDPEMPKYPNIFYNEEKLTVPSWLMLERYKENLGLGKYSSIYKNPID
ncbi:39S ribosomal protein L38, mitochondrial [Trichinella papuae]|uniref:39S ribosomal protein L38, mitochondrial n=1 Tax=Trichinella papuae TaxID=268474 RepID=A0A0V1M601_9BILA|nr:39S ribosomal protein L38, mitochondrial [Trichinella papuae]